MKLLDIVIPAWNAHNTIHRLLGSIICQTRLFDIKITIVDDCSDKEYDISIYKDICDIQVLRLKERISVGAVRNYGMDNTNCPFIMFCDADDALFRVDMIDLYLKVFLSNTYCDAVYGQVQCVEGENDIVSLIAPSNHFSWLHGAVFKREYLKNNDIRFIDNQDGEDIAFNIQIKLASKNNLSNIAFYNTPTYLWTDWNKKDRITTKKRSLVDSKPGLVDGYLHAFRNYLNDTNNEWVAQNVADIIVCTYFQSQESIEIFGDDGLLAQNSFKRFFKEIVSMFKNKIKPEMYEHQMNIRLAGSNYTEKHDVSFEEWLNYMFKETGI